MKSVTTSQHRLLDSSELGRLERSAIEICRLRNPRLAILSQTSVAIRASTGRGASSAASRSAQLAPCKVRKSDTAASNSAPKAACAECRSCARSPPGLGVSAASCRLANATTASWKQSCPRNLSGISSCRKRVHGALQPCSLRRSDQVELMIFQDWALPTGAALWCL